MKKSKLSIIPIDIDFNIEQLIKEEASTISNKTSNLIEQSIANAKLVQQIKESKEKEKEAVANKQHVIMTEIYHKLLDKLTEGVPVATVYDLSTEVASTPSGFTIKFKTFLKEKGNPYIIQKIKKNGTQYFILLPYNTKD
jgi:hypothetical protein